MATAGRAGDTLLLNCAMARALLLIALACVAAVALASGPQTYQCENHFFRVADAALSNGKDAGWSANDDITITIVGRDHDHELTYVSAPSIYLHTVDLNSKGRR